LYVEYPLGEIKPKEDFVKMLYTLFGMFFDHYKDSKDELIIEQNDEKRFTVHFHWDLSDEEKAKLDELMRYYHDRRTNKILPQ